MQAFAMALMYQQQTLDVLLCRFLFPLQCLRGLPARFLRAHPDLMLR